MSKHGFHRIMFMSPIALIGYACFCHNTHVMVIRASYFFVYCFLIWLCIHIIYIYIFIFVFLYVWSYVYIYMFAFKHKSDVYSLDLFF